MKSQNSRIGKSGGGKLRTCAYERLDLQKSVCFLVFVLSAASSFTLVLEVPANGRHMRLIQVKDPQAPESVFSLCLFVFEHPHPSSPNFELPRSSTLFFFGGGEGDC